MNKTQLLKNIFDVANKGVVVNINNLPIGSSREVVEKNLLYIELKRLVKNGGNIDRINEIKGILYPIEEETENE